MKSRVLQMCVMAGALVLIAPQSSDAQNETVSDLVAAAKLARSQEREKAAALDRMLAQLATQTIARRVFEAARKRDTAEVTRIVRRAMGEAADIMIEQVAADSCLRLRVAWKQFGGGTVNLTIGCGRT